MITRYDLVEVNGELVFIPTPEGRWVEYQEHDRIVDDLHDEIRSTNERLSEDGL